eukprot:SAG31_NODE_17519_length_667_cov_3.568662_1_plen_178_part_10
MAVNEDLTQCDDVSDLGDQLNNVDVVMDVLESSENIVPTATLEIIADPAAAVAGSTAQAQLLEDLVTEMAAALGIPRTAIANAVLVEPSSAAGRRLHESPNGLALELKFEISSTTDTDSVDAAAAMQELTQQIADESSPLRNSATTSRINSDSQLQFGFTCPLGMVRGDGEANCRFCA